MQTRRAAKKQRIETGPLLGPVHLPSEIIDNNLLRCLDLRSLLLLSTCNSAFKREVFRKQIGGDQHASIWQIIDFGSVPSKMAAKLTDDQLKKLLIKCHAKEVTTVLKLTGCVGLKGAGLEPLRGSIALREADLRFSDDQGLETTFVLNLLSSMPPIAPVPASFGDRHLGLALIKFPVRNPDVRNDFWRFSDDVGRWLIKHNEAVQEKAIQLRTRCGHCRGAVCDRWSNEDMWWVMNTSYCEECKALTCRGSMADLEKESGCPMVEDCSICMRQCCRGTWYQSASCGRDRENLYCHECDLRACEDCADWEWCESCDNWFCGKGDCGRGQWCEKCEKWFCGKGDCDRGVFFCEGCGMTHCWDC